jgi:hypothetical protein
LVSGKPRKPPRVNPKVKQAILYLIDMEHPRLEDAAKSVGMTTKNLREQLRFPHVVRYLQEERRARLEAACASNPEALLKIRDTTENAMAAVQAAKALEQMRIEESQAGGSSTGARQVPGVVIIVEDHRLPEVERPTIEVKSLPIPIEPELPSGLGRVERGIYGPPGGEP